MRQKPERTTAIQDVQIEAGAARGLLSRALESRLLMDAITCMTLSWGCLMALFSFTVLDGGLRSCFIMACVMTIIVMGLSRRWWLSPVALALFSAGYAIKHIWAGDLLEQIGYIESFLHWIAIGVPYSNDVAENAFLSVLQVLIAFAVTVVLFVLIRRLFFFPAILLLQAGVLTVSFCLSSTDLSAPICVSAAGLIILLPRVYARRIARSEEQKGVTAAQTGLLRARMQLVAIPAAVVAVVLALMITPQDTPVWKSYRLNLLIQDIGTWSNSPFSQWPSSYSGYQLESMGFQTQNGRLGGPVTLKGDLYLSVQTPQPVLLKGRVLDYYTGYSWDVSRPDGDLRLKSLFGRGTMRETFDLDQPYGGKTARELYRQLTTDVEITVTHERRIFNTLFTAGGISDVTSNRSAMTLEPYYNRRSELYLHGIMPSWAGYAMQTRVWKTGTVGFDTLFTQLEEQTRGDRLFESVSARYTQLPETLPESVRNTAAAITDGIASPYLQAKAISRWLAENADYTLEPEMPPEDMDFTAHFLETRKGYCVYFATAMTVLARCEGLPARYVQGFALENGTKSNQYIATGQSAHAWSEIYFEGIGWMPFDPLDWSPEAPLNQEEPDVEPSETVPPPTASLRPAASASSAENPPSEPSPVTEPPTENEGGNLIVWLVIFALLGFLAMRIAFRLLLWAAPRCKLRRWAFERVHRRYPDEPAQLNAVYRDILRLLALNELTVRPGETLVSFPERIDAFMRFDGLTLSACAKPLMQLHFNGTPPSCDDVSYACHYHACLEEHTLDRLGKVRYLFKCGLRR